MAKKVRRTRRPIPSGEPFYERPEPVAPPASRLPARRVTEEELREEYAYVLKDLRWIFILAALMFTLLIVLNLVLR
jgi:hypothetical protein